MECVLLAHLITRLRAVLFACLFEIEKKATTENEQTDKRMKNERAKDAFRWQSEQKRVL